MILIFLLLLPWYINAMTNDFNWWIGILEEEQTDRSTNPTIATEQTPVPASTTIIIPAQATSLAAARAQQNLETDASACSTNPIPSNNNHSPARGPNPYRNMRRQAQQTPIPQSQMRWGTPESHRPGQFIMRCFYEGCPWGFTYNWPVDEEQFRYLQLVCTERVWKHCHDTHWGLKPINEYVITQLQNPTQAPPQGE